MKSIHLLPNDPKRPIPEDQHMKKHTLGSYLKSARLKKKLTATEVAALTNIGSPLQVLTWERDQGQVLPLRTLKKLIFLYDLDVQVVFDLILQYQMSRIEQKFIKLIEG